MMGGIIFYKYPLDSLLSLAYFIGMLFVVVGILRVIRYFSDYMFKSGSFLILGILDILMGIIMLYTQPFTALTLAMFFGFWEVFSGLSEIVTSIDLKQVGLPRWWIGVLGGVLGILLGIMLIKNPALSSIYLGIYAFLYGLTFISTFFALSQFTKD